MAFSFIRQWFGRLDTSAEETTQNQADSGQPEAQFMRGLKLASGEGTSQDYVEAARWYGQAAEQDHTLAQFNLGVMYSQGQGVQRDAAKSLMWMTRAANLGDAAAQYKVGVQKHLASQHDPKQAAPECRIEALKWVRLSAAQGYLGAEGACQYVALEMTKEEVAEGGRRATAFTTTAKAKAP